ncbi:MAG TPA: UDP binding domain-containing protein, partial [Ancylobacter sp.]
VQEVARGIGLDGRIGAKFLHAGPGYGGSCFPKDTLALIRTAQEAGSPVRLIETVTTVNETRKAAMGRRVLDMLEGPARGSTVAVLGLTFKPNTDDMRDSPAINIVQSLVDRGVKVRAYDPVGMEEARKVLPAGVEYADGPYECAEGADCLVIVTEWDAFRALDLDRLKGLLRSPAIVDLRNIYPPNDLISRGFRYVGIGRTS